jgi:hypothetical protein
MVYASKIKIGDVLFHNNNSNYLDLERGATAFRVEKIDKTDRDFTKVTGSVVQDFGLRPQLVVGSEYIVYIQSRKGHPYLHKPTLEEVFIDLL